jgi:simple sugar transport system substrate-binding protein
MKHHRLSALLGLLLIVSIVLAACGGQEAEAPAEPTEATEPTSAEEDAEATPEDEDAEPTEAPPDAEPEEPAETPDDADTGTDEPFVFGMVLVGPINDAGWSQAHYEGALYAEERAENAEFIYIDKVNPADRPNIQVEQVVDDLVDQGAQLIITNSDDFKDGTREAARAYPEIPFIHISGDDVLTGQAPPNLSNIMGQMIYGKMMAGCAAALHTQTGNIAYLGPLVNSETLRLVNSAYLGAQYCYNNVREDKPTEELSFEVTWIGFWFNIPGQTLDPTQVANDFINTGNDVIISGIDTTEALVEANKATQEGQEVYALPYDFEGACEQAPDVCLGVPYFNWGPTYLDVIEQVQEGTWEQTWLWIPPDWDDINNLDTSAIGFERGPALTEEDNQQLTTFIDGLADDSIQLFVGPLTYQDGTTFLEEGEVASDEQIWYMSQLLEGIEGSSE